MHGPLLAITSHGNAPFLMAAYLARSLGNRPVVIPHYYGEAQRQILLNELPDGEDHIYLSKDLGDLLWPLLFDKKNGQPFADFAARLANPSNSDGILAVEQRVNHLLDEGVPGTTLRNKKPVHFARHEFAGVLQNAQPIRVNLDNQYFFFTSLLSDLYGLPSSDHSSRDELAAVEKQQGYARLWKRMEDGCTIRFIPRIHAFSYREGSFPGIVDTPPLSFVRKKVSRLQGEGILFSPSGTGTDVSKLMAVSRLIPNKYQRYILTGMNNLSDFPENQFKRVSKDAFGDEGTQCVVARGGWGTIWECLMNEKPLMVVRTSYLEDPEMGHTQKTLEQMGLAVVWDGPDTPFLNEEKLSTIRARLHEEKEVDGSLFGAEADNGFRFIANKILAYEASGHS